MLNFPEVAGKGRMRAPRQEMPERCFSREMPENRGLFVVSPDRHYFSRKSRERTVVRKLILALKQERQKLRGAHKKLEKRGDFIPETNLDPTIQFPTPLVYNNKE